MSSARGAWRSRYRSELLTLAVCVGLTGAHLGYRSVVAPSDPAPVRVSSLGVGALVSGAALGAGPDDGACRLIITFSPDCPFCKRAAERERRVERAPRYRSTTWVTDQERAALATFEAGLPVAASPLVDAGLYSALEVRAVPGLYLLDREGWVRWIGPYRGDESTELLDARCSGPDRSDAAEFSA
jgi:hypothetical protein